MQKNKHTPTRNSTNKRYILIADDNKEFVSNLADILELYHYTIEKTYSTNEALEKLSSCSFHAALLDLKLPDGSGIDLVAKIKNMHPDCHCIIMTAYADVSTVIKALEIGVFHYLIKPFEHIELIRTLERIFEVIQLREEKLLAEKELARSEKRYHDISTLTTAYIYHVTVGMDNTMEVDWLTDGFTRLTGYSLDDVQFPELWKNIVYPDDLNPLYDLFNEILLGKQKEMEFRLIQKDGDILWLNVYGKPELNDEGKVVGIIGAVSDISQHKNKEETLKNLNETLEQKVNERAEELERIFELSIDMICIANIIDNYFIKINPAFRKTLGFSNEELLGKPFLDFVHPNDRAKTIDVIEKNLSLGIKVVNFENRYLCKDGSYKWLAWTANPIPEQGITYAIARDITKPKQDEEENNKLKELLYHSQKLESVGRLAGGVAHDFNNMLMAIIGYTNLAEMIIKEGDPAREYLKKILESTDKAKNLTQSLLAFSRKQPVSLVRSDMNAIIENVSVFLTKVTPESIKCILKLTSVKCAIMADSDKLEQVIMNLVINSVDAMPNGGELTIRSEVVELDYNDIKKHALPRTGKYGVITVSDTGSGMDEETKKKIFEPFFTTKEKGKGTGIGLSIAYGIIQQHNGHIEVLSEPNKGTTMNLYLPVTEAEGNEAEPAGTTILGENPSFRKETILIAEDEAGVREVVTMILKHRGYKVISAVNGEDAIKKYEENKGNIDMLLFDVMMPKKGGKEAYDTIKKTRPDTKVLFMSGYSDDIVTNKEILERGIFFIQKPVAPDKLLEHVRKILDS